MLASGVALAANFVGTDRKDTIDATDTADIIIGKWGDDTINAKGGNDYIYGDYNYDNRNFDNPRSNHDTIDAGAGADYIDGGNQADDITAGPLLEVDQDMLEVDQDTVFGQHGNDQIDTANYPASLDYVFCGTETDYAMADPLKL